MMRLERDKAPLQFLSQYYSEATNQWWFLSTILNTQFMNNISNWNKSQKGQSH